MRVTLNEHSQTPKYLQIKNSIKQQILDRELLSGFRLPSERDLAKALGVNRNTVIRAYDELIKDGLLRVSAAPRAYMVTVDRQQEQDPAGEKSRFSVLEQNRKLRFTRSDELFEELYARSDHAGSISFAGMVPDRALYPLEDIQRIMGELMAQRRPELFEICSPQGLEALRGEIARHLRANDVRALSGNIQIVAETTQAIECIAELYLSVGDRVIVEEPMLPDLLSAFQNKGVQVVPVSMDEDGMVIEHLEQLVRQHRPALIYTMPNYHNITTAVMPLERRRALLACARRYGVGVVEDDHQSELRYSQRREPTLYAMDSGNVIYLNSFIFTFVPGMRIAYMAASQALIRSFRRIVSNQQLCINVLGQYLLAQFLAEGSYDAQVERVRACYREKRDVLCRGLDGLAPLGLTYRMPQGGLAVWCRLPAGARQKRLLDAARAKGLLFMPGFLFYPFGDRGESSIRLCFSFATLEEIRRGVEILGEALEEIL